MEPIKIAIWGFGAMGQGMAEMLLSKKGVAIVGVCDVDYNFVGKTVEDILKNNHQCRTPIVEDIDSMLDNAKPDLVLLCTDSFVSGAYNKIEKILKKKINCITTAEEMAYPLESHPKKAKALDDLAKENGVTVLGTGINPGFIMDLMVIALSGAMIDVEKIKVERINSLSPFGPAVMEEQGVGNSLEQYHERVKNNQLVGHVGFQQSVDMIFKGLGVRPSRFEQQMKPILTSIDRKSKYATAKKGTLAGINMTAQGYLANKIFIEMHHPQQIEPEAEGVRTGDYIYLTGKPNIQMAISPEIDGGLGTIAICVNMIPHVLNAKAGLKTMLDLPVPRAILGDMRDMLEITK